MPADLQRLIEAPTPYLRVSPAIDQKQRTKHLRYVAIYLDLTMFIADWTWLRVVERSKEGAKWEVIFYVSDPLSGRLVPITAVIGADSNASFNLLSMHCIDESRVRRFIREGQLMPRTV